MLEQPAQPHPTSNGTFGWRCRPVAGQPVDSGRWKKSKFEPRAIGRIDKPVSMTDISPALGAPTFAREVAPKSLKSRALPIFGFTD